MKLSTSVLSLLLLSVSLSGAVHAARQTTCIQTRSAVELTEEMIAIVLRDTDTGIYFDRSLATFVEVRQQGCVSNTEGLQMEPSDPYMPQA